MARASVNIITQLGIEGIPGVAVPANRKLLGMDFEFSPILGTKFYRPAGDKFNKVGVLNTVASKGSFQGNLSYTEAMYIFESYIGGSAPTIVGVSGQRRVYTPGTTTSDAFKTFTIQRGDASAAEQTTNVAVESITITLGHNDALMSGTVIGQALTYGATLTAAPTQIALAPVSGNEISLFIDPTFAALGTTQLTDASSAVITLPAKYKDKWVLDATRTSWKELVEIPMAPSITVIAEFNAQTRALYSAMVSNQLPAQYLRAIATGPAIAGGTANNALQFDAALKVKSATERKDVDAIYGYEFVFEPVDDTAMNAPYIATITNAIAAL